MSDKNEIVDEFDGEEMHGDVGSFTLAPAGNHPAICVSVVLIGTIDTTFKGNPVRKKLIRIGFELPKQRHVFNEAKGEEPFVVYKEYTFSMGNSNFKKMLESWRGEPFASKEEAKKFNVVKLLGCECMANIVVKTSGNGNQYNDIATVTPLPDGLEVPAQSNKSTLFNFNPPFKTEVFNSLPEFIQNKIKSSDEYKALGGEAPASTSQSSTQATAATTGAKKKGLPF